MRGGPPLPPELRELLDRERAIQPISAAQRARAVARAQASLGASAAAMATRSATPARPRWVAAAAATLVLGVAVGAAAYGARARWRSKNDPTHDSRRDPKSTIDLGKAPKIQPTADPTAPSMAAPVAPEAPAPEVIAAVGQPAPSAVAPGPSPVVAAHEELRLLRQARDAVARGDFAGALSPIAEHTRRFKNGRLAEEREALRVRALASLGRTNEARRAAAAFRARFPRSVLSPAVGQMSTGQP